MTPPKGRSSLALLVVLGAAACTSIIGLPELPELGDSGGSAGSGQAGAGSSARGGTASSAGGTASSAGGTASSAGGSGAGGSSARGGTTAGGGTGDASGDAGATSSGGGGAMGSGGTSPQTGGSGGSGAMDGSGGTRGSGGGAAGTSGGSGGAGGSGASGGAGGSGASGGASGAGGSAAGGSGATGGSGGLGGSSAGTGGSAGSGGSGGGPSTGSSGCGKAPTIASSMWNNGQHIGISAGGMQRSYVLNVPTNYDNTHPYRLVIAYHQSSATADDTFQGEYYHLLSLADQSAIFVAPNGQANGADCTGTSGCGWPNANNTDVALTDAVVAELESNFCVDTQQIFATGWSYGGAMSFRIACDRPLGSAMGYIRAVAVYSGADLSGGSCIPSKPVAYYASHGTADAVLTYDGGVQLAQKFANVNGCDWMTPTKVTTGNHICTDEAGCKSGYPVRFCSFAGSHTADPDNGQAGSSWEYQEVWTFLSQF